MLACFKLLFLTKVRLTCNPLCLDTIIRAYCAPRQDMSDCFLHVHISDPEGLRANGLWIITSLIRPNGSYIQLL